MELVSRKHLQVTRTTAIKALRTMCISKVPLLLAFKAMVSELSAYSFCAAFRIGSTDAMIGRYRSLRSAPFSRPSLGGQWNACGGAPFSSSKLG